MITVTTRGVVTLPGGERVTLHGFLPLGFCPTCGTYREPPYFFGAHWWRNRRRFVDFCGVCLACECRAFPPDLKGLTLIDPYRPDGYTPVGWQQRTRAGKFGDLYALSAMQFRRTADGVLRPQPKFDRQAAGAVPHVPQTRRPVLLSAGEQARLYSRLEVAQAVAQQHGICLACGQPFTVTDPAVGDHHRAWKESRTTAPGECVALHHSCNLYKSDRTYPEIRQSRAELDVPLPFGDE